ncbi:hypothetical protein [Cystobacter fuscus]|uniref:hypothetical protein n=1 Tax=Cystobacter fuscus TaxID=43 RepID=UPI0037BECAFB
MAKDEPYEAPDAAVHFPRIRRIDENICFGKGPLDVLTHGLVQLAFIGTHEGFGLAAHIHRTPLTTALGDAPGELVNALVSRSISRHEEKSGTIDFPERLDFFPSLERMQDVRTPPIATIRHEQLMSHLPDGTQGQPRHRVRALHLLAQSGSCLHVLLVIGELVPLRVQVDAESFDFV